MESLLKQLDQHVLEHGTLKGGEHYVEEFVLTTLDLASYTKFSADTYVRNLVCKTDNVSILVLCWDCGQKSPIHNHPEQGCIMRMLQGTLTEKKFSVDNLDEPTSELDFSDGNVSYIDNSLGVHLISNRHETQKAISLHCYSPAVFQATIY
jgi:cysteine dioxygenase